VTAAELTSRGHGIFDIDYVVPSSNQRLVNSRDPADRAKYRETRDDWQTLVMAAMRAHGVPKATGRRALVLIRFFSGRERARDYDNLVGGMKPVLDAMVLAGLIVGDDPGSVVVTYHQNKIDGPSGLRVEWSNAGALWTPAPPSPSDTLTDRVKRLEDEVETLRYQVGVLRHAEAISE
jgi:hypothetical protein